MTTLMALWLPILLSAVIVFVVSWIIHMVLPWHKGDYPQLANEDKVLSALRPLKIPPGDYMMPRPSDPKEMRTPEFSAKMKRGPVLVMTVMPNGQVNMGKNLALWFVYAAFVSYCAAYIGGRALPPGAPYLRVFQMVGASAFMGYSLALLQMSIWYSRGWGLTLKSMADGLVYSLFTAGVFGWLWPK
jgi:hypothetical protein